MEITRIERSHQKLDAVYIDGKFECRINHDLLVSNRLDVGSHIEPEKFEELLLCSECDRARDKAFWLLGHRAHTRKELLDKLSRSFSKEAAEFAVKRMENLGFLDDKDYACRYASELAERRGYAANRIVYELCRRGIDKELAEETVEQLSLDPTEQIINLIKKKFGHAMQAPNDKNRVIAALRRYGFTWAEISPCLKKWETEYADSLDEENVAKDTENYKEQIIYMLKTKYRHSLNNEKDRKHTIESLVSRGFSRLQVERLVSEICEKEF